MAADPSGAASAVAAGAEAAGAGVEESEAESPPQPEIIKATTAIVIAVRKYTRMVCGLRSKNDGSESIETIDGRFDFLIICKLRERRKTEINHSRRVART